MVNAEITEEINTRQSWICMADVLRAYQAAEILVCTHAAKNIDRSEQATSDYFESGKGWGTLKVVIFRVLGQYFSSLLVETA